MLFLLLRLHASGTPPANRHVGETRQAGNARVLLQNNHHGQVEYGRQHGMDEDLYDDTMPLSAQAAGIDAIEGEDNPENGSDEEESKVQREPSSDIAGDDSDDGERSNDDDDSSDIKVEGTHDDDDLEPVNGLSEEDLFLVAGLNVMEVQEDAPSVASSCPSTIDLASVIKEVMVDDLSIDEFELFSYCIKNRVTNECYIELLKLRRFNDNDLPRRLPTLIAKVLKAVKHCCPIQTHACRIYTMRRARKTRKKSRRSVLPAATNNDDSSVLETKLTEVSVPYILPVDFIKVWLATPALLRELRDSFNVYTKPYLNSREHLRAQIRHIDDRYRSTREDNATAISVIELGKEWLKVIDEQWEQMHPKLQANGVLCHSLRRAGYCGAIGVVHRCVESWKKKSKR